MKKIVSIAILSALVSGCVMTHLDEGLAQLVGKPIESAIDVLGFPNSTMQITGYTVYVWDSHSTGIAPVATTANTSGMVGGTYVSGTSSTSGFIALPGLYHCQIKLATDSEGIVRHQESYGNPGGCGRYKNKVSHLRK